MNNKSKISVVAELKDGIILSDYKPKVDYTLREGYQSEADLEKQLLEDLVNQGYQEDKIKNIADLFTNLKVQIERLNNTTFTDDEWNRFLNEYLNPISEDKVDKAKKIHDDYIKDFIFDDGHIENIKIIDKENWSNNILQVTSQFSYNGQYRNRYDVTILVNGLPLVHIELKRRGISLEEAFNQIGRYDNQSFNESDSLFKFVQIFVISNGTYTRYFSNTTSRERNNFEFTCEWADAKNNPIKDLKDFTSTFFEKRTLLEVLTKYCVFTSQKELLIMRPYQIAATERILWKIKSSYNMKNFGTEEAGGYIWHTTGSGKTLTSFKTAKLATKIDYIDKIFFIVDRKDLDFQTMKEYQKYQENSVNGSSNTKALIRAIEKEDGKIIVTTIQKLNNFIKSNSNHEIYEKHCVLIFDECHRSQFGDYQKKIKEKFKKNYQFGFTGTPIFTANAVNDNETTKSVFGAELHSYVITHAIRDEKVLKFKVDYINTIPKYLNAEKEAIKESDLLHHPDRIKAITEHILDTFNEKTRRGKSYAYKKKSLNGFNSMFAVDKIDTAMQYYNEFKKQQESIEGNRKLVVATIFSNTTHEEGGFVGEIQDENFEPTGLELGKRKFLEQVIVDYNERFKTNFSIEGNEFNNYYKDLSKRVKDREIDLVIVVGMFLTGFDAPTLNTLFVDKNLKYHGLIQAFSRTNRILNKVKPYGNIVCFRDLNIEVNEAISLFADDNGKNIILEKSFEDYMNGFKDDITGENIIGYDLVCKKLLEKFSNPTAIELDSEKIDFCKLFGKFLKLENKLKNFDEFQNIKEEERIIPTALKQDMQSVYVNLRDELNKKREKRYTPEEYDGIEFQIELLKTDEINLDFILELIINRRKQGDSFDMILEEIKRIIRSNIDIRAKEDLIISYLNQNNVGEFDSYEQILSSFYSYAKVKKVEAINQIIEDEKLKDGANGFIEKSISRGSISNVGTELNDILPPLSRRAGVKEKKKQDVLTKIEQLINIYIEI